LAGNGCYSNDGPDHWVIANGHESNHVTWGSRSTSEGGGSSSGSGSGSQPPSTNQSPTQSSSPPAVAPETCARLAGKYLPNVGWMPSNLWSQYRFGGGVPVLLDWSFLSGRADFVEFAHKIVPGQQAPFQTAASDPDLFLALGAFTVTRSKGGSCYYVQDHYDFFPANLRSALDSEHFDRAKFFEDILTLPAWAYQMAGAREFDVYAYGKL
jgi:hypothetical protein